MGYCPGSATVLYRYFRGVLRSAACLVSARGLIASVCKVSSPSHLRSHLIQGALAYSGLGASWTHAILLDFGGFGPPIGAVVVIWTAGGRLRTWVGQMVGWRIGGKWWARALGFPFLIISIGVLAGGPRDLTDVELRFIFLFAMAWGTVWGGGQEDLGWRGFMQPIRQDASSVLASSGIVVVTWAAWHLPMFLNATTTHGG